ncbi:hypothetical protein [Chitinophaga rhizophila]|nr:hypothetical protein [Chitinophaga rhizophila]
MHKYIFAHVRTSPAGFCTYARVLAFPLYVGFAYLHAMVADIYT